MAPVPTSAMATAALVLAILGVMCLGPLGSITAVLVGLLALWEIKQSHGTKGGTVMAAIAVGLGAVVSLAFGLVIAAVVVTGTKTAAAPPTAVPTSAPTWTSPTALPSPGPTPALTGTSMSREENTVELTVGPITVVDVGMGVRSLESELQTQRVKAQGAKQTLVLQTTSLSCRPCLGVAASLTDARMQKALSGVRLVRVEIHDFSEELAAMGIPANIIPGFFLLDTRLRPTDGISGGEWDEDVAQNMAPVLGAFVHGSYSRRRERWTPPAGQAPGGGTML